MTTRPSWIFDGSEIADPFGFGERAVRALRTLKHPKSALPGRAFQLDPWQERIVRRIYGPRHPDGTRIVRKVFLLLPRGNRKTSLAAALALLHTVGPERVPGGEVIFAASDREQASIGFKEAVGIVREDPRLLAATRIYDAHNSVKKIVLKAGAVTLQAISGEGGQQHGRTPTFILADELHIWKGRELWEALQNAMVKTPGTLLVIATTAGRGQDNVAFDQYNYARKVALGEIDDPTFLPILFEADADADWRDEAVWHDTNPGLPYGYPDLVGLRQLAREAESRPVEADAFRQFNLNVWLAHSRTPLFDMGVYDEGAVDFDLTDLAELPCYIGVDLSRNGDLTAIVAAWRHDDGAISIEPWFFLPDDDLRGRSDRDGVPYQQWKDTGALITTSGPIIEPETVEAHIRELCAANDNVQEIAFDPAMASTMMARLIRDGLPVVEMPQRPLVMGAAVADLERTVNGRNLRHRGHPILRNHFDNVVAKISSADIVHMKKATHRDRIDGAVAAAMAVSRATANDNAPSIYDDPEFLKTYGYGT
jgi:phage terminase large subunit-like protein